MAQSTRVCNAMMKGKMMVASLTRREQLEMLDGLIGRSIRLADTVDESMLSAMLSGCHDQVTLALGALAGPGLKPRVSLLN